MKKFKKFIAVVALCALAAQATATFTSDVKEPVMVAKACFKSDLDVITFII